MNGVTKALLCATLLLAGSFRLAGGSFLFNHDTRYSASNSQSIALRRHTGLYATGPTIDCLSRRDWLKTSVAAAIFAPAAAAMADGTSTQAATSRPKPDAGIVSEQAKLAPVNLTVVATENSINVTMLCREPMSGASCVKVDPVTFNKIRIRDYPSWWPDRLRVPPKVVREVSNVELLVASALAGASVDIVRTALLYPLLTIKTRIQAVANRRSRIRHTRKRNWLKRRLQILTLNFRRQFQEGNLYAGLVPTLLVSVPATGVYYGSRDVTKRVLNQMIESPTRSDTIAIALIGALVADVVSLAARTPADTLALRLQVVRGIEDDIEEDEGLLVGDWVADSVERLPAVIGTDLPYLLLRIGLNMLIATGSESIGGYELISIATGCTCALMTTPFDVVRTRLLVDNVFDRRLRRNGVLGTMKAITREGDGGVRNLFAGWFERITYLGLGRAWLDPFIMLSYVAIRDAVLLKWFN